MPLNVKGRLADVFLCGLDIYIADRKKGINSNQVIIVIMNDRLSDFLVASVKNSLFKETFVV